MNNENVLLIIRVVVVLILITATPFVVIWSLNVLFGLKIPFAIKTWAAVACLIIILLRLCKQRR